jgi:hypothetical protein
MRTRTFSTNMKRRKTTATEIEAEWAKELRRIELKEGLLPKTRDSQLGKASGYQDNRWEDLKAKIEPGDELWVVSAPDEDWDQGLGQEWIVLLRAGNEIARMLTRMN